MLSSLFFFVLFEAVEPSYGSLLYLLPEQVVIYGEAPSLSLAAAHAPVKKGQSIGPVVAAESVYSVDSTTGTPLLVHNVFYRRPIASIAKLMTAMVILDSHKLDEVAKISKNAALEEGSRMGLREGESLTVRALLTGMLVNSGNDAAVALAEFNAGSEANFVEKLNAKAARLGLSNTHFSNAKGFDEEGNFSTAFDTMRFANEALTYHLIREITSIKKGEVFSTDGKIKHVLESTNELLENAYFPIIGLKTGRTPAAGESFVSLTKAPNGHEVVTVLLSSPDRFKETKIVVDWILRNYDFPAKSGAAS